MIGVVLQCGHPFCETCADLIKECSKCRQPIVSRQKLFLN
jgi:hypothetical protein